MDHVSGSLTDEGVYLEVKTKDRPHHIGYACSLTTNKKGAKSSKKTDYKYAAQSLTIDIEKGELEYVKEFSKDCNKVGISHVT